MAQNEKEDYVNSLIIKTHTFENGGIILKVSAELEKLKAELDAMAKNGWININIIERKAPSEKGITHYAKIDRWEPDSTEKKKAVPPKEEDLPF